MRFRGQPNYNAMFKHYGIASVNIAPPEVYTALERGAVQGYGWPLWGIDDFGWDKLTKVRIDPGFYNVVVKILMNKNSVRQADARAAQGAGRRRRSGSRRIPATTPSQTTKDSLEARTRAASRRRLRPANGRRSRWSSIGTT